MVLIDKDATKADIEKFNRPLCDGYHMKDYILNQIINDIEDMPTVKAIPIVWMKKYVEENYYYDTVIARMIEDWEKENG